MTILYLQHSGAGADVPLPPILPPPVSPPPTPGTDIPPGPEEDPGEIHPVEEPPPADPDDPAKKPMIM